MIGVLNAVAMTTTILRQKQQEQARSEVNAGMTAVLANAMGMGETLAQLYEKEPHQSYCSIHKRHDCEGCGAPLQRLAHHCEYCGRQT
jgi:hypothetical protein